MGPAPLGLKSCLQGGGEIPSLGIDNLVAYKSAIPLAVEGHQQPTARLGAAEFRFPPHQLKNLDRPRGEQISKSGYITVDN